MPPFDRFEAARFGNARPIHAGMMQRYVRGNWLKLMDESPACFSIPFINGPPTSNQTSFNTASCIWRPEERHVRTTLVRRFRLRFRAAITGGADKARVRFFASMSYEIPEDAPADKFATVTSGDVDGAADDYGPFDLILQGSNVTFFNDHYKVVLGAQAETDNGGTTVTVYRIWGEETDA